MSIAAPTPFDHPKADVILRSSDNVDFRVFKLFLSLASPFFETMFELPQPSLEDSDEEIKDGLAVISVTEDSKTLDTLLRFCYPSTLAEDPSLEKLTDVVEVLDAARKYSLELIERKVGHALGSQTILEKEPFRAFAIACHSKLESETRTAAKFTLRQPFIPPIVKELELITAMDLRQLLDYRMRCASATQKLTSLQWIYNHYGQSGCKWLTDTYHSSVGGRQGPQVILVGGGPQQSSSTCGNKHSDSHPSGGSFARNETVPNWWVDYMNATWAALKDNPSGVVVLGGVDAAVKIARSGCTYCGQRVLENMTEFARVFSEEVEKVVAEIQLDTEGMSVASGH